MIDDKNRKILIELQRDARQADAVIARKLGLSEAAVRRRISRLINAGVTRITAVAAPWKIGLETVAFFGIQAEIQKLDQVMDALAKLKRIHWVSFTTGRFDIMTWATFHSHHEMANYIKNEIAAIDGIRMLESMFCLEFRKRDQKILEDHQINIDTLKKKGTAEKSGSKEKSARQSIKIDERDLAIISALQDNARQSDAQISRQLKMSESTVRRRIQNLIQNDVINVAAVIDPLKVGYNMVAFIHIQANLSELDSICQRFAEMPRVHAIAFTTGWADIFLFATFHSHKELSEFATNYIANTPGITRTETFISLEIRKRDLSIL
jgi:Lrp/AsnC family transcriptional regulator for asnA, asnC and gidA